MFTFLKSIFGTQILSEMSVERVFMALFRLRKLNFRFLSNHFNRRENEISMENSSSFMSRISMTVKVAETGGRYFFYCWGNMTKLWSSKMSPISYSWNVCIICCLVCCNVHKSSWLLALINIFKTWLSKLFIMHY